MSDSPSQQRGPISARSQRRYNVVLDEELAEWGKHRPGGLSALLRRLLKLSHEREGRRGKHADTQ